MIDPCALTSLQAFAIPDLVAFDVGVIVTQPLPFVADTAGQAANIRDLCGPRVFLLETSQAFVELAGDTLRFKSDLVQLNTDYYVEVRVSLSDYPNVLPVKAEALVKVSVCRVDKIIAPSDISMAYFIRTGQVAVPLDIFKQSPDCAVPLVYTAMLASGSNLPSFMQVLGKSLIVKTDSLGDMGTFMITVTAATPTDYKHARQKASLAVSIEVKFDCQTD